MNADEIDTSAPLLGEDFTGRKIGRLTILGFAGVWIRPHTQKKVWRCRCDCGTEKIIPQVYFTHRNVISCGCFGRQQRRLSTTTHGFAAAGNAHPFYVCWQGMIRRCEDPKDLSWKWYGALGVKVCDRWRASFIFFKEDLFQTWQPGLTIERKDPFGDYTPENVTWATYRQQARNRRKTKRFTFQGISITLAEWSERTGIKQGTLYGRVVTQGWPIEEALTAPLTRPGCHRKPPL